VSNIQIIYKEKYIWKKQFCNVLKNSCALGFANRPSYYLHMIERELQKEERKLQKDTETIFNIKTDYISNNSKE
jgi:hypothetical protein